MHYFRIFPFPTSLVVLKVTKSRHCLSVFGNISKARIYPILLGQISKWPPVSLKHDDGFWILGQT